MARRFQFRLEQVLALRKQMEDVKVRALSQAKGELLRVEEALKNHYREEKEFLGQYGEFEKTGAFNSDQAMAYCEYKDWLLRREKEYRQREREWIKEVERRRQEAIKASRARQLLENLKERQVRAHQKEVLGEEQRFLDEISSIAFVRRDRVQKSMNAETAHLGR